MNALFITMAIIAHLFFVAELSSDEPITSGRAVCFYANLFVVIYFWVSLAQWVMA
jgi:hypothetical protein